MYSVAGYGQMLSDQTRVRAYAEAMERAIKPGCVVLDIGTGTGFFAMLACRLGARKVYAVEPDEIIQLAKVAARVNGFADRIEFLQDLSTRIDLPEQVDVIVSDLRTVVPWFQHHVPTIVHARETFLKPGGILIPQQDEVWATVVEMPQFYAECVGHQPQHTAGFDMSAARHLGASAWTKAHAKPEQFLTKPRKLATLDFRHVTETDVEARLEWVVERSGIGHGFVAWFDTTLLDDIGFSNAPGGEPLLYGNAFFPWQEPVPVCKGDAVAITLQARLVEDDYFWRWDSVVTGSRDSEAPRARFSQNNLSAIRALRSFRSRGASYVPSPTDGLKIDLFILGCIDGERSSREIAEEVATRFPETYRTWEAALHAVSDLSARYAGRDVRR
jgi:protein arginine N-methyltransferase 1